MSNQEKTLCISEKCIQCGSCIGLVPDYFEEDSDGSINVRADVKINDGDANVEKLLSVCPVGAISFANLKQIQTQKLNELIKKLENFPLIPIPQEKDFPFSSDEYSISLSASQYRSGYDYSSDSAAERAAQSVFNGVFSQVDNAILQVITAYRVKYVKPYYTTDLEEGSIYAKANKQLESILQDIKSILGNKLPSNFTSVPISPDTSEIYWKMLNKGEILSDEMVSSIRRDFNYSASDYSCYWDTDYTERYVGSDWRGNMKTKDMYCFSGINNAIRELEKDILRECGYCKSNLQKRAVEITKFLVEQYNKKLIAVRDEKIKKVKAVI